MRLKLNIVTNSEQIQQIAIAADGMEGQTTVWGATVVAPEKVHEVFC